MRTKITERNMYNVMGKVNTFFKKNVMQDLGEKERLAGHKNCEILGMENFEIPYYKTYHAYSAYPGTCHVHHLRKAILKS